jgi:hypothetical protein
MISEQAVQHYCSKVVSRLFSTACLVMFDRPCSTVMIVNCCLVAISALKIAPRRIPENCTTVGILVIITPVFAHGCTGIRKWFADGTGMRCFAMPLC